MPATARSGARSKKHSSAPSPPALGHPAEGQQRVRSRYGRRAGRLHAATRRRLSAGLPRRDLEATHCRNARADPDESGTPGPFRLRVRAQWHRQSLHDVCSARRLAPRQGHRSPYRGGLRSRLERLGRHPLRARQHHRWSRTISASTARLHSTKPFRPSKPGAWSSASNGTTLQNTAAGSIWPSSELGVLTSQCLDRRIPNKQILIDEIAAWEHDRNANHSSTSLPPLKERALAIAEKALGPEHRGTAATLNNLAGLLQDQGDLVAARPLLERALAFAEKALGPEHPDTGTSLNNLALLMHEQGDLGRARQLYQRALAIAEKALGPEHRHTNPTRRNLSSPTPCRRPAHRSARPRRNRSHRSRKGSWTGSRLDQGQRPRLGYRRVTAELHGEGRIVNTPC